jgi:hypothetical protein
VFTLEFEDTCRILLVRFSGVLMPEDISEIDQVVTKVIASGGSLHGLLLDFCSVQAVGVPQTFIAFRASLPLISRDCERVFVVPSRELRELAQAYAAQQRAHGTRAPHLVHSMSDAYEVLQLERPNFRPLGWPGC